LFFFDIFVLNARNSSIVGGTDADFPIALVWFRGSRGFFPESFKKDLDGTSIPED
jgi:hypothetical protein